MTKHVVSTTKKLLSAGGLAFGLAGFGLFGAVGTAVADGTTPDTGTYDELVEVHDAVVLDIDDSNATHEVPDTGSYDELLAIGRDSVVHTPGGVT